jgi:catechol 2,3-dioxygenase-like lactoylglutathione lyase family enzyme
MSIPHLAVTSVTITTPDPRLSAEFYSRLLDRAVSEVGDTVPGRPETVDWAAVRAPRGSGELTLGFEYEREWRRPVWPSEPERQSATQHLDIQVDDLAAAVDHAVAAGARPASFQPQEDVRVLYDPVGHPFCLFL